MATQALVAAVVVLTSCSYHAARQPRPRAVDARDFGADGADRVDDTLAIEAAIAEAARRTPAVVLLPPGELLVRDLEPLDAAAVDLRDLRDVTIRGHGTTQTRLVLGGPRMAHVVAITGCRGVTLEQLAIVGASDALDSGHGVRVASSTGVQLRDLAIRHASHYGIGVQRGEVSVEIERVEISDSGGDGIDVKEIGGRAVVSIQAVRVERPGRFRGGQAALDLRGDVSLRDVVVLDVPRGGTGIRFRGASSNGDAASDARLSDFRVEAASTAIGVEIAADRVRVTRGSIRGSWTGVLVSARDTFLRDVHVDGAAGYGFRETENARRTVAVDCRSSRGRRGWWIRADDSVMVRARAQDNSECDVCDPSSTR